MSLADLMIKPVERDESPMGAKATSLASSVPGGLKFIERGVDQTVFVSMSDEVFILLSGETVAKRVKFEA